jgi:hypothetical protein
MEVDAKTQQALIYGAVGEAAGRAFQGHLRLAQQIPDMEDIITNPMTAPVPTGENGPGILYMLMGKLSRRLDKGCSKAIVQYLDRLPPEQAVVCINEATARDATLKKDINVLKWSSNNMTLMVGS